MEALYDDLVEGEGDTGGGGDDAKAAQDDEPDWLADWADPAATHIDRLLDPQALGSYILHVFGSSLSYKMKAELLTREVVKKDLFILHFKLQQHPIRVPSSSIFNGTSS